MSVQSFGDIRASSTENEARFQGKAEKFHEEKQLSFYAIVMQNQKALEKLGITAIKDNPGEAPSAQFPAKLLGKDKKMLKIIKKVFKKLPSPLMVIVSSKCGDSSNWFFMEESKLNMIKGSEVGQDEFESHYKKISDVYRTQSPNVLQLLSDG